MPPKRMTANPIRAARHRPGKILHDEDSSDADSASSEAEEKNPISAPPKASTAGAITSNLSRVDLNARRQEAAAKEAQRIEDEKAARLGEEDGFVTASEEESGEEDGSEEESEEEESESEEEAPRRVMIKPTFIKKGQRSGTSATKNDEETEEDSIAVEEERRRKAADDIVEEQIRKDIAAKEAGKKNWDDDEEEDEVDDTDGLDPEAEYAAWKLRELKRIKRDREAIEERERELAEVERRKNLTEEERRAEDDDFIAKQKEEKDGKAKMAYMQKYYHKGAFFQDDLKADGLDKRDIMGARFTDDVNRELLPQALQMRDMTKLGKKGASKYRDLKTEDTGKWGQFDDRRLGKMVPGGYSTDERFMPDRDRGGPSSGSGANNMPIGERNKISGAPEGLRAMRDVGDLPKSRDGESSYRHDHDEWSRSRSRSPERDRYRGDRRRKRSTSRDGDRYDSDKRRRVDSR